MESAMGERYTAETGYPTVSYSADFPDNDAIFAFEDADGPWELTAEQVNTQRAAMRAANLAGRAVDTKLQRAIAPHEEAPVSLDLGCDVPIPTGEKNPDL
jgi:hypothetical protein